VADEAQPVWTTENIQIATFNFEWIELADGYRDELTSCLRNFAIGPIEHIGSTAVSGLPAKPVIDLMLSVPDKDEVASDVARALEPLRWSLVPPDVDMRPWRLFFAKVSRDGNHRLAHLHVMSEGEPRWREQLAFRDLLQQDPQLRSEYAALKKSLAAGMAEDREAYAAGKSEFIARAIGARP
jgi:GrpB-like predicted nucleotidyltransferase (UPF0157 family)